MIKLIIFFPQNRLSVRDYERFGIEIIKSNGYSVEVWDFTPVLRPYYFSNVDIESPKDFLSNKVFFDEKKIRNDISKLTSTDIVVCLIHNSDSTKFIFETLEKSNIKYGLVSLTSHPENYSKKLRYILLFDSIKQNPFLIIKKIIFKLKNITHPINNVEISPSFIICDGEKGIEKFPNYTKNKKVNIINAHHLDYDAYLNEMLKQENPVVEKGSYSVYIDMNLPFSMDSSYGDGKNQPSAMANTFYPVIKNFFDKFELEFNMKIVIAAHPRSNYTGTKQTLYGKRLIIKNKTHNLIKHSKCVLTHHSTAAGLAVIYNKPMIFLSPQVINKRIRSRIKFIAKKFGQRPINISLNHIPSIKIDSINNNAYKVYKNNYIKMDGTIEKPIWDIFCDNLKRF